MTNEQPEPSDWEDRCRDCDDTGVTIQTERRCACQPPLQVEQPEQWATEKSHQAWLTANANNHIESGGYSEHAIFDMGWDAAQRTFTERTADLVADNAKLREALVQHNDRLRSAAAIAGRDGKSTDWLSFRGQVHYTLAEYHELTNECRQALAQQDKPDAK